MRRQVRTTRPDWLRQGFTLTEMMIVVAIIAILAAFLAPSVHKFVRRSAGRGAARRVANTLQLAHNEAMSRGEVVLAKVSDHNASAASGGTVELFVTDNRGKDGCTAATDDEMKVTTDPNCFARTCAQAKWMTRKSVYKVDFAKEAPDMIIHGIDPAPAAGHARTFCFDPSGRVVDEGGLPLSSDAAYGCDAVNARIFISAKTKTDNTNPVYGSGPNLVKCVDAITKPDDREKQKDGRDVANFFAIYLSYDGTVSTEQ